MNQTMRTTWAMQRRAFSLVEIMVVIVLMGIMAAVVAPGLGAMDDHSRDAGIEELMRSLRYARAQAAATGAPTGVRIRSNGQARIAFARINPDTGSVESVPGPLGDVLGAVQLDEQYSKFQILSMTNGDNVDSDDVRIWFDYEGVPHTRQVDGTFVANFTTDAVLRVKDVPTETGGILHAVLVLQYSGFVEKIEIVY